MTKLVIIDGMAILHRAYHAMPPLTTRGGEPINAVYGFVSMLLRVIQDLKPTHLVLCMDRKEPTFRHMAFEEYQSHRPETDKDLVGQFAKAKKVAKAMNIPVYSKAGFEADDVIGTIARKIKIDEVIIVTGDKDILQLVSDKEKIRVYLPVKGLSKTELVDEKGVIEKLGVRADQIIDYKSLVGDPSDNYKGVPGIGPKTAEKLLSKFKTKKTIYSNLDKVEERIANLLRDHKTSADMSYKLATIETKVPIKFKVNDMSKWQIDSPKLFKIFEEYSFRTLAKRVKDYGEKIENEKQGKLFQ